MREEGRHNTGKREKEIRRKRGRRKREGEGERNKERERGRRNREVQRREEKEGERRKFIKHDCTILHTCMDTDPSDVQCPADQSYR